MYTKVSDNVYTSRVYITVWGSVYITHANVTLLNENSIVFITMK